MEAASSVAAPAAVTVVPVGPVAAPAPAPPAPLPASPSPSVAPPIEPPAGPPIADADRLPPPLLYECRTYNDDRYLSERGDPPQRCVTLTTTGLGGMIEGGTGAACEMKSDQCQRVPDGALCDSWRQRQREAESALRFGVTEDRVQAEAELQRLARIVGESTCGRQ